LTVGGRGEEASGGGAGGEVLQFEWDPAKSASNKLKHGIDFDEAKAIWQDAKRFVTDADHTGPEPRQVTVGLLNGKMHAAITTMRGDTIRIISVRRARRDEEANYGGAAQVHQQ
jgi:uncharacterized DUF497 family protein